MALGNGNGLGGLFGGNNQQLNSLMMENPVLKAAQDTDKKLVEVYTELRKQDKQQDANVAAINVQLANMNAANAALVVQVNNLQAVLSSITKCVVPNSSVCPGWGNVTITPAASTSSSGPVFSIVLVLKILLMGIKKDKGFFFYVVPFVISYGSSSVIAEAFKGFLKLTMKQEVSLICSIAIPLFIILEFMLTMAINTEKDEKENKDIDKN